LSRVPHMSRALHACRLPLLVTALWWGGITALSLVAVPVLFIRLGSPALAGPVAAFLFQVQAGVSVALALGLLLWSQVRVPVARARGLWPWLLLAALAALLQEFAVAEKIVTARAQGADLRLWHGLGSVLVALQWWAAFRSLWWMSAHCAATCQASEV